MRLNRIVLDHHRCKITRSYARRALYRDPGRYRLRDLDRYPTPLGKIGSGILYLEYDNYTTFGAKRLGLGSIPSSKESSHARKKKVKCSKARFGLRIPSERGAFPVIWLSNFQACWELVSPFSSGLGFRRFFGMFLVVFWFMIDSFISNRCSILRRISVITSLSAPRSSARNDSLRKRSTASLTGTSSRRRSQDYSRIKKERGRRTSLPAEGIQLLSKKQPLVAHIVVPEALKPQSIKRKPYSPRRGGFNKWWATKVSSSFFTPLTSCKADKVGTLVFTLRLGIMPGVPSSMMPKVPKYGVGTALVCSIWETGAFMESYSGDWALIQSACSDFMEELAFGLDLTLYEGSDSPFDGLARFDSSTAKTEIARPARAIKEGEEWLLTLGPLFSGYWAEECAWDDRD
ncbi:hypothetical protein Salat_2972900 [Sesamum alatum]|uniref:Uncharacterized protein n=1 Tax=Sesamum alatum TaxID=300844 RepID=A0AAE1XHQ0_9LAMI|nr:hypothetical protein Salat_2972900 [Sesamum alatum]